MPKLRLRRNFRDAYRFPGFVPAMLIRGVFGHPQARGVSLQRRKKTACGICGRGHRSYYDHELQVVRDLSCGDLRIYLELEVRRVDCGRCGHVKRERLTWLADNPFYTRRFAFRVRLLAEEEAGAVEVDVGQLQPPRAALGNIPRFVQVGGGMLAEHFWLFGSRQAELNP